MTTPTDTPRTDAAFGQGKHGVMKLPYETSCELERELAASNAEVEFYKNGVKAYVDACEPIRGMDKLGLQLGECIIQHGVPRLLESHEKAEAEVERLKGEVMKAARILATIVDALEQAVPWVKTTLNPATEDSSAPQS